MTTIAFGRTGMRAVILALAVCSGFAAVATAPAKLCVYEPCATNKDGKWPLPPLPYPYDSLVVRPSTPSFSPRLCVSGLRIAQGADVLLSAALSLTSTTRRCTSTTTQ